MQTPQTLASPSTRRFAREREVDLDALSHELGQSWLNRTDVERKLGGSSAPTAAPRSDTSPWDQDHSRFGPVEAEPTSRLSRLAATNLSAAQQVIPAVTHQDRADMSAIERFRSSLKNEAQARGTKLSSLAFHVKALALSLRIFPRFNASLSTDGETLWLKHYIHIGIAVDTPNGLMVPVIRDADRKGIFAIADEIIDLAGRARDRKLSPDEMAGASMTISNLGGIGGQSFTPIVNPPEVAILGLTRTTVEPVWDGEAFAPTAFCPLSLSYDHRVINGADAARFLTHYARMLADPREMLI
ncbi:MAG: 2-oxo acid dehydrogenase subunit E2 [Salinisphaera sp.]|jgi:pyruvate/2-oxoglutarate dehydrogenase complex dihydrolipoamide acyltransferase (E2) component|nr:2-oxo acid dehydrogenase subunit E2 [Salinisphaera sp.]